MRHAIKAARFTNSDLGSCLEDLFPHDPVSDVRYDEKRVRDDLSAQKIGRIRMRRYAAAIFELCRGKRAYFEFLNKMVHLRVSRVLPLKKAHSLLLAEMLQKKGTVARSEAVALSETYAEILGSCRAFDEISGFKPGTTESQLSFILPIADIRRAS